MRRAPGLNPFLPVPRDEQQRLRLLANLSLAELATSRHADLADLLALVNLCNHLVVGDKFTPEAREAVRAADEALSGLQAGTVSHAATVDAVGALVGVFEQMLATVTWRKLQAAQEAARRLATLVPPAPR